MPTNNKGLKELWGYPLIDEKARNAISDTRSSLENDFQKKTDDTLGTVDKTVPGAINEIKNNIDNIGDNFTSEQTETKYDMKYNGKSIGTIGIELKDNQIAGGDGSFNIDLTPYQTKTDTSLTTTDKTLSGAINEVNAKCKEIAKYLCNNNNFVSSIGSNRELILTEDISVQKIELNNINGLTISSLDSQKNINITGKGFWDNIVLKDCSNIKFDNLNITSPNCESSAIILHSKCSFIEITNCNIESKANGIGTGEWLDTTDDNYLKDILIHNNTFNVNRMCIEIMNRTDFTRVYNLKIYNNKFIWGKGDELSDSTKIAVSCVGLQSNTVVDNNIFDSSNTGFWGVEYCGCVSGSVSNNTFLGNAHYSIHFSKKDEIQSKNCLISNNTCLYNASTYNHNMVLRNITKSIIKSNICTSITVTNGSNYNTISENNTISNLISGVIGIGDNSSKNTICNNIIYCTNEDKNCRGILISGENTTKNLIVNNLITLLSSATAELYVQELSPATGNVMEGNKGYLE